MLEIITLMFVTIIITLTIYSIVYDIRVNYQLRKYKKNHGL